MKSTVLASVRTPSELLTSVSTYCKLMLMSVDSPLLEDEAAESSMLSDELVVAGSSLVLVVPLASMASSSALKV